MLYVQYYYTIYILFDVIYPYCIDIDVYKMAQDERQVGSIINRYSTINGP